MFSSVSGLGRLFNSASASISSQSSKAQRHYDSVTEESVTYDLLYPETDTLHEGQHHIYPIRYGDPTSLAAAAQSTDDRGGLDVHASRDVRILIGQKTNDINRVLFDTHPPTPYSTTRTGAMKPPEYNGQSKENRPAGGLGGSTRLRKARTAPHSRQTSLSQTGQSIFSSPSSPLPNLEQGGTFGGSKFRGITRPSTGEGESIQTKIAREEKEETDDMVNCMFGASGFLSTSSTKIHVKPYTPSSRGSSRPTSPETYGSYPSRGLDPRRTMLSRSTTAENLPGLSKSLSGVSEQQLSRRTSSYLLITKLFSIDLKDDDFPNSNGIPNGTASTEGWKPRKPSTSRDNASTKQIKTPTFAVAIVLYIPHHVHLTRPGTPAQSPHNLTFGSQGSMVDSAQNGTFNELDDQIARAMDRWPIIIRTISSFEILTRAVLKTMLVDQCLDSEPRNRRALQLEPLALQHCRKAQDASNISRKRLAQAFRIRPTITGQDRWPIWRDVARGIGQAPASQEQNPFLANLLTGFLGAHIDWLDLLAPRWYRRQHTKQQRHRQDEVDVIPSRTVIIAVDKMAARRLVFLLSSFLPSNYTTILHQAHKSFDVYGSTPPKSRPMNRQDSLRRPIKSRTSVLAGDRSGGTSIANVEGNGWPMSTHKRRPSDAASIRSIALPIASSGTRKSSTTTTATVLPSPQQAIPLFSSFSPEIATAVSAELRPGSSGSLAALSLKRTLSRSESNERSNSSTDSQGRERYGSIRSGFWTSRRGSSTENSEVMGSSGEGLGITGMTPNKNHTSGINKLSKMVEEAGMERAPKVQDFKAVERPTATTMPKQALKKSPPKSIPRSSPPQTFPLTLSVDEKDGVVDVQYSPSASIVSIPSAYTSPRRAQAATGSLPTLSPPPFHPTNVYNPISPMSDSTINVAGWLHTYHPDFILQAVRPYATLKAEIKHSMRLFPSQIPISNSSKDASDPSPWIKVSTTLLVDTATNTLTLLNLHRKNANSPHHITNALLHHPIDPAEEYLTEHTLSDADPVLSEAVERAVAHNNSFHSSRAGSRAASPPPHDSPSMVGQPQKLVQDRSGGAEQMPKGSGDVKKTILGALARVAKDVATEVEERGGKDVVCQDVRRGNGKDEGGSAGVGERKSEGDGGEDNFLRAAVRKWVRDVKNGAT